MLRHMYLFLCLFRAKKIVLQGTNMAHLLELQALAMSLSLPTKLVQDAGHTQVSGTSMQTRLQFNIANGGKIILFYVFTGFMFTKYL